MTDEEADQLKRFLAAVNRQGYAFQNRVLLETERLRREGSSRWNFEAAEFPVEAGGAGTRIDFILSEIRRSAWILGECKRVNPAYSDWLFLRTPYVGRNHVERYIAETCWRHEVGVFMARATSILFPPEDRVFHIGFDVKTEQKGDPSGARAAIEEAASQVSRGMNGMVNYLSSHPSSLAPVGRLVLLPVIFTTAKLYAGEATWDQVDLASGELDPDRFSAREVPYLFYQYHLSPGIKHDVGHLTKANNLSDLLALEGIRTIPVVNSAGIGAFLRNINSEAFTVSELDGNTLNSME